MGSARVLCVGWDGADLETIDSLIERGRLPHLARLREAGIAGPLEALPGLADDAHWASFATSCTPDVHGRFHHEHPASDWYYQTNFPREQMTIPPFWEQLAAAGQQVAVLDVPKSPLGSHPALRVLADWMPHGEDGPDPVGTPSNLVDDLVARYGAAPPLDCHRVIAAGEEMAIASAVERRLDLRTRVALDWLEEQDWDLFQVVFAEDHCVGHHCWHVHDAGHPEHRADRRELLGDIVEEMYVSQDAALGRLIAAAGTEASVIVFSPLGMGPNYNGEAVVQPVLRRLADTMASETGVKDGLRGRMSRVVRRLPWLGGKLPLAMERPIQNRPYWHLQHDAISSAIRLNVVGREPMGVIKPGLDFDRHRDLVIETFRSLRRVADGSEIVAEVVDVASAYPGPERERFADLLVVWDRSAPVGEVTSPLLGRIDGVPKPMRTGNHRTPGWSVIAGPGLTTDGIHRAGRPESVIELGQTIANLLGTSIEPSTDAVP